MINISLPDTRGKKIAKPSLDSFPSEIVKCGNGCVIPSKTLKLGVTSKIMVQETLTSVAFPSAWSVTLPCALYSAVSCLTRPAWGIFVQD